ncbi:MAG: helix-turn-helix transcriptional regulator [Proteobacteria bacterium]|nr:helix-turn-helix transcriptional regulator [Pseudomonadota bacterium]
MFTSAMRIRRARLSAQLSQTDMADKVRVTRSAVAQWERDTGTRPSVENLTRVATVTHVHFEWLATGRGPMKASDSHQAAALTISECAHDELESRLLHAIRRLSAIKRSAVVQMVEALAR